MSNPTSAPFEVISDNDKGASLSIVNCILIIFSGLVVVARAVIRRKITRLIAIDDLAVHSALVFAIAQTVCAQLARNHGLGKHRDDVSPSDFESYSKDIYASQILTIVVMTCTKWAICYLIRTIRPIGSVRRLCLALDVVVGLWALTSILALSFQCSLPSPWLLGQGRCVNLAALFYFIGTLNILTDTALSILPIFMIWDLQLQPGKKLLVLALFLTRILVPATVIPQLVYLKQVLDSLDGDQTWNNTEPMILNQVALNLSIITACIPSLRRVVTDLVTNQTGLKLTENLEMTIDSYSSRPQETEGTSQNAHSKPKEISGESRGKHSFPYGHNVHSRVGNITSIYTSRDRDKGECKQSSEEHLRSENIDFTAEVGVEEEDNRISTGDRKQGR